MTDMTAAMDDALSPEEAARADLYGLLAALLARPPEPELLTQLSGVGGGDRTSPLGAALSDLAAAAAGASAPAVRREYDTLFIGMSRGELLPYQSYYLSGFLHDKPLADLRDRMARLGVERAPERREPEDHIATLCEMMAGLIRGAFGAPGSVAEQKDLFEAHLAPWAARFFKDVETSETSAFYEPVGRLGRAFMALEAQAFGLER